MFLFATSLLLLAPPATVTGQPVPELAEFDRLIVSVVEKYQIPGAALAVMKDGRVVLSHGYGFSDQERKTPTAPDALFRIASVSKPVTAVAVMKLVQEGRLKLEDRAFDLLKLGQPADPRAAAITVRQLLLHSAGFDRGQSFDPMFRPEATSPEAIIRFMMGRKLDFDPGSRHAYSNFGYCILGRIIERVSGRTYEEYVQQQVLSPMGIRRMRIGAAAREQAAPGEVWYDGPFAYNLRPDVMDAHGGWIASAADLVRFADSVSKVLKPESIREMTARPAAPLFEGAEGWYALGWQVAPRQGGQVWSHNGAMQGTSSLLVRSPNGMVWAVVFNRMPPNLGSVMTEVGRGLRQASEGVTRWP